MLSSLIFSPIILGASFFFVPKKYLKPTALGASLLCFFLSLGLFCFFDPSTAHLQMVQKIPLIPFLGMNYFLGVDGLSFWYVLLTAFLLPLTVLCSWKQNQPLYFFFLFLLCGTVMGTFLSFDSLLFFLFFDMTLIPLFFLIYLWGGKDRVYAAFKFLIYTFFASLFLLAALVTLMLISKQSLGYLSASLLDFYKLDLVFVPGGFLNTQTLLFFCCALAFAVKTPLFPFHTWLPLAHGEAPTAGSVYLAAVVLKMGTYGWFRLVLPLFPAASLYYSPVLLFLAVLGLIYASLVAFAQTDLKKLVAYSSVAHIAFVPIGIFAFNVYGMFGGFYQTLTHAVSSAGLFLIVGLLYERTHTREMGNYGGLSKSMPWCAIVFFIITLSSIALPLTAGFVSEFLTLLGSYLSGGKWVWFAVAGVVLSAVYMLNVFQKVFLGEEKTNLKSLGDLNRRELAILIPIVLLVFLMGVFPNLFFKYSRASLEQLSANYSNYQLKVYMPDEQKKEDIELQSDLSEVLFQKDSKRLDFTSGEKF
ncbi:MAG: NADH-quinone oxidoreductase subunit M [Bdellovibrionales bacterium]|nr:NADH-quinone oxidoreductase subunit M [Bdellovibrionales bacterium]